MKILIIKLGYSETLDPEIGKVPSLGDVLRTTPLLLPLKEKYKEATISWLVSKEAEPLINNNPYIDRILVWDEFVPFQLMREKFDVVISLEKIPGVCALADMIDAWVKYGFRFDSNTGTYHAYENGLQFIDYIDGKKGKNHKADFWQKSLIEMLGLLWNNQEYVLGYKPKTVEKFDVGFNWKVGSKWPVKGMNEGIWKELEGSFQENGVSVSWQEGLANLYEYMDWINSCKTIISCDSLGLHLALALKKNVIGLFGPTDDSEVFYYGRGVSVKSGVNCDKMPCYSMVDCATKKICMDNIPIDTIVQSVLLFK